MKTTRTDATMGITIENVTLDQLQALAFEADRAGDELGASIVNSAMREIRRDNRAHSRARRGHHDQRPRNLAVSAEGAA